MRDVISPRRCTEPVHVKKTEEDRLLRNSLGSLPTMSHLISTISPAQRPTQSMTRTPSRSLSPRKNKRASLILPSYVQFAPASTHSMPPREPSPEQSTRELDIMTALAAQERRVLELKEELSKAEKELEGLKNQWATHESTKRRNESRRMHHMRPMSISSAKNVDLGDDPDGSSAWMYEEMEKRKALLGNNSKPSHRRVFSGSRHTKELSLLSPIKTQSNDVVHVIADEIDERRARDPVKKVIPPVQSILTLDSTSLVGGPVLNLDQRGRNRSRSPQREDLLRTGKQVATDLRDGLWTFFEDLRQAAVGDEPRAGHNSSTMRAPNSARPTPQRISPSRANGKSVTQDTEHGSEAANSFWKDHGLAEPKILSTSAATKPAKVRTPQKPVLNTFDSDGDSWEAWDSPTSPARSAKKGNSSVVSANSSPNTSVASSSNIGSQQQRPEQKKEAIPWPTLTNLAPGQLRRTATHLMEELERSLTPPYSSDGLVVDRNGGGIGGFVGSTHDGLLH